MPQIPNPSRLFQPPQPPLRVYRSAFDPTFGGALTPRFWLHLRDFAQVYQDNGTSTPVTAGSQPVGRIYDRISAAGYWFQGTGTDKPTCVSAGSKFGLSFDGGDRLTSSASKSYYQFLHTAAGYSRFIRVTYPSTDSGAVQIIMDGSNSNNTGNGNTIGINDGGAAFTRPYGWICRTNPSVANVIATYASTVDTTRTTSPLTILDHYQYNVTGDDYSFWINGANVWTRNTENTPGTGDSVGTLTLGSYQSGSNGTTAVISEILIYEGNTAGANSTYRNAIFDYLATGE